MSLSGEELIRRFLLHLLPKGFIRVRHFGFLANRSRAQRLAVIRTALVAPAPTGAEPSQPAAQFDGYPWPKCRKGRLQVTARLAPQRRGGGGDEGDRADPKDRAPVGAHRPPAGRQLRSRRICKMVYTSSSTASLVTPATPAEPRECPVYVPRCPAPSPAGGRRPRSQG